MAFDINRIREAVAGDWGRIESLLKEALGSDIDILNTVNAHILSNSGKQLRPLLSLLAARACSGGHPVEASFHYAAASELLHNATLLHDDVADSSDERRGMPTLRALMGSSVSVLVGDFWMAKAVRLVLSEGVNPMTD
ncbi:MAG: polyprenyl synthetase family protein, partial [Porphyromonadaceae bacterium]|nr:polyprenyl synthetase family protein [Porphyromonadaceae bacterium]